MQARDDAYFWEGAQAGKLLLRICARCGQIAHPPVPMCSRCHSLHWSTRQASGRGEVYSWLESRHPSQPDAAPRIVALIDLEEGQRLVSNLIGIALEDVRPGLPVEVTFETVGEHVLPKFRPVQEGAA